jgi:transcriptional regulator with XRE-family HTH domain
MIAEMQARSIGVQCAPVAGYPARMVGTPDMTPAVSRVRNAQAVRLKRLRELLDLTIRESSDMAGASEDVWSRMERGLANIDAVKLARWCLANAVPGEYVLTGSLLGMPDHINRALVEAEVRARLAAEGHISPAAPIVRRGRPRKVRKERNEGGERPEGGEAPDPSVASIDG